jgi:hypothetical protein
MKKEIDCLPVSGFDVQPTGGDAAPGVILILYGRTNAGAEVEIATTILRPEAAGMLADALLDARGKLWR